MTDNRKSCNEEGSVLVVALIILVLLTIIGISASDISNIEIQIAGNERIYKRNFYRAEAAAMHGIQLMEDADLDLDPLSWLKVDKNINQLTDDTYWNANSQQSMDAQATYLAGNEQLVPGASLDMSKTTVFQYDVLGRSTLNNGRVTIGVGYRKAF
jgi:hypothetical protein